MVKEIVGQVLFVALLFYVVIGNQDSNTYIQNQDLRNRLMSTYEVVQKEQIWSWINSNLLPTLYYVEDYNANPVTTYDNQFIANAYGYRLGPPRIRQIRVKQESCKPPKMVEKFGYRCTKGLSSQNVDGVDYLPGWQPMNNNSVSSTSNIAVQESFLHSSAQEQNGIDYWGYFDSYSAGGYVANLGSSYQTASEITNLLQNKSWIDEYTRVIFVEFNVWNANTNLFNMFMTSIEIRDFGKVVNWVTIDSINLYRYAGPSGLLNLLAEIILVIVFLVITGLAIYRMIKHGKHYWTFWNIITVANIIFYFTAFGIYVWRSVLTVQKVEEMKNNKGKSVNFQLLSLGNGLYMYLLSFITFLSVMHVLHLLRYNKTISIMGETLSKALKELLGLFTVLAIFICAFGALLWTLFQSQLEDYRSIYSTISSLTQAFLGSFDYYAILEQTGVFGAVILLIYLIIMMFLVMNMFVAMLNEVLAAVQDSPDALPDDYEVVEYFIDTLKAMFGMAPSLTSSEKKKKNRFQGFQGNSRLSSAFSFYRVPRPLTVTEIEVDKKLDDLVNIVDDLEPTLTTVAVDNLLMDFFIWNGGDTVSPFNTSQKKTKQLEILENIEDDEVFETELQDDVDEMMDFALRKLLLEQRNKDRLRPK